MKWWLIKHHMYTEVEKTIRYLNHTDNDEGQIQNDYYIYKSASIHRAQ